MVTFLVAEGSERFRFSVPQKAVMLAGSPFKEHTLVACAFEQQVEYSYSRGLLPTKVVPDNLPSVARQVR